jgi:YD repeat-containing protein
VLQSSKTTSINSNDWVATFDKNLGGFGGYQYTSPELRTDYIALDENKRIKTREVNGLLKVQYDYDANGRINKIYRGSGVDERATLFTYYNSGPMNGELHTITNAVGHSVTFEYDSIGRIVKQVLPDLREIVYTFDSNDNLASLSPAG